MFLAIIELVRELITSNMQSKYVTTDKTDKNKTMYWQPVCSVFPNLLKLFQIVFCLF